jgi:UPF0716 protein FxsA
MCHASGAVRRLALLLLLAAPFVELYLLVVIARQVGIWPVIGFVVASALLGGRLARREGRRVLTDLEAARAAGEAPREGLLSAGLLAAAGVLLVVPGVISTLCGLALLVPATRRLLSHAARGWFEKRIGVLETADPGATVDAGEALPPESGRVIDIDDHGRPVV